METRKQIINKEGYAGVIVGIEGCSTRARRQIKVFMRDGFLFELFY